jgi:hypothetical protein
MAKGKKSSGKTYTSAGVHSNVSSATRRQMHEAYIASGMRIFNQLEAFRDGKRVTVTVPTGDKSAPFKRVDAKTVWKNGSKEKYCMQSMQ